MNKEKENKAHTEENSENNIKGELNPKGGDEILKNMLNTPPKTHEEMKDEKS